ncbi:hypothetical protein S40285_06520 [Stachybotrys chlorohalonatus IBT 40285]|uniref:Rieske domain-containing protein n=1 Tax=Stachybotrys chlorohalonatus (strain IBT 40285) TaxID=1283841 RepID=A0A084QMF2_STAC4|nr:hypothetical protein S40285_06520 [Stachybotrys chlorohalonata IBT 40285]
MAFSFATSRHQNQWHFVGLASSFPNITTADSEHLSAQYRCGEGFKPGCKVFSVPEKDADGKEGIHEVDLDDTPDAALLKEQIMIFKYNGKLHALDHKCPHSSFPLSRGIPFDIEDFGVVLSAGLMCPKHDWSFDLFTGRADRGGYMLKLWELQLRPVSSSEKGEEKEQVEQDEEVWVRRKQRIG